MAEASCHSPGSTEARTGCETVVLVGNPNVGKSVVFNAMTGTYVDVSNFPGTTVELTRGRVGEHDIVDTPGVYGVSSFNDEETVARDIILSGDIVVNVVDAVHLERDLFLTLQLVDMVAGRFDADEATTARDGAGDENGEHHRERRDVLAALVKPHEPFPSEGDGFGDFVGSLIGALQVREGDAGVRFDLGHEGEEGDVQFF